MNLTLDKIELYLNELLEYDWKRFNDFDMAKQCQEWTRLKNDFNDLVNSVCLKEKFDFKKIYALIKSYDDKFIDLTIEGKLYVEVSKRLLSGQLIQIIREIEYEEVKKTENLACECEILSRFGKDPEIDKLTEIGIINDRYYLPKLFSCNNCGFKWISYVSDDSIGKTLLEKYNKEDENLVEYY